jgi:hypothetical protein
MRRGLFTTRVKYGCPIVVGVGVSNGVFRNTTVNAFSNVVDAI